MAGAGAPGGAGAGGVADTSPAALIAAGRGKNGTRLRRALWQQRLDPRVTSASGRRSRRRMDARRCRRTGRATNRGPDGVGGAGRGGLPRGHGFEARARRHSLSCRFETRARQRNAPRGRRRRTSREARCHVLPPAAITDASTMPSTVPAQWKWAGPVLAQLSCCFPPCRKVFLVPPCFHQTTPCQSIAAFLSVQTHCKWAQTGYSPAGRCYNLKDSGVDPAVRFTCRDHVNYVTLMNVKKPHAAISGQVFHCALSHSCTSPGRH